jgi:predicted phage tail protein
LAAKTPKEPSPRKERTAEDLQRLGYVPLPGMPALVEKDMAGFGIALGAAVPLTAIWAGAVGKHAQSGAEFATLTALGFYALTVSINKMTNPGRKAEGSGQPMTEAD